MDPAHRAWPRPAAPPTVIHFHTYAGAYLYLVWTRRAELGLDPLPPRVHPAEAWQQYAPFLQAGGAVLMRTAVLLGTKTLGAAVATRLGPASIASHQVPGQGWGRGCTGGRGRSVCRDAACLDRLAPGDLLQGGGGIGWGAGMDERADSGREGQDCDGSRGGSWTPEAVGEQ